MAPTPLRVCLWKQKVLTPARLIGQTCVDSELDLDQYCIQRRLYNASAFMVRFECRYRLHWPALAMIWSWLAAIDLHHKVPLTQVIQVMEFFSSLFFQEVQSLSALQTSLRFLPSIVSGSVLNIWTGLYAHKFRADYLVSITTLVSAGAPLLMALINPKESYWYSAFWAMVISPLSADGRLYPTNKVNVILTVDAPP